MKSTRLEEIKWTPIKICFLDIKIRAPIKMGNFQTIHSAQEQSIAL